MQHDPVAAEVEHWATVAVDSAMAVRKEMGPGLLGSVYHDCMKIELRERDAPFETEARVPLCYHGKPVASPLIVDLLIDRSLILELKAVDALHKVHTAQLLAYLKLTDLRLGLLINFNTKLLMQGIKRVIR